MSGLIQSGSGAFEQASRGRSDQRWTAAELEWARKRIMNRHKLRVDVASFVLINAFLVAVWAFNVAVWAVNGKGYFWAGWVTAGWGALLLVGAWNLYDQKPIMQEDLDHQLRREH